MDVAVVNVDVVVRDRSGKLLSAILPMSWRASRKHVQPSRWSSVRPEVRARRRRRPPLVFKQAAAGGGHIQAVKGDGMVVGT
jgi:hypothetical protein